MYLGYRVAVTPAMNRSMQSLPGIERDKTMAYELIYIPNDDTQNFPICKLVVEMFGF